MDRARQVTTVLHFGITPKKQVALAARMAALGIEERDLEERFICAGGPGGQKVNRTATCVYLRHRPTGLEVKMQRERSQALNRYLARRRLCELMEAQSLGAESPEAQRRSKIRKQKNRRARRGAARPGENGRDSAETADDAGTE